MAIESGYHEICPNHYYYHHRYHEQTIGVIIDIVTVQMLPFNLIIMMRITY